MEKGQRKMWIGIGIGVLVIGAGAAGISYYRNRDDESTSDGIDEQPDGSVKASEIPTAGTENLVNIPVVSRPAVRPDVTGNMFGIPTVTRPDVNQSNPTSGGTVYRSFSQNERIAPKPDGTFVFVFKSRPPQGFINQGEQISIAGTIGYFDGIKTVEKLFIDDNGKIGGVYLKLNNPNLTQAMKSILSANEYVFAGKAVASKKQ